MTFHSYVSVPQACSPSQYSYMYPIKWWFSHVWLIMLILLPFVSLAFGGLEQIWKITEKNEPLDFGVRYFRATQQQYIGSWCQLPVEIKVEKMLKPAELDLWRETWAHRNPEWQYIPMLATTISIWPIKMVISGYLPIPSHSWCLLRTVHVVANLRLSLRRRPERKSETPQRLLEFGVRATKTGEFAMKNGGVAVKIDGFAVKNGSSILAWTCVILLWQNDVEPMNHFGLFRHRGLLKCRFNMIYHGDYM